MGIGMAALSLFLCATLAACVCLGIEFFYINLKWRVPFFPNTTLESIIMMMLIIFFVIGMFVTSHMYYNVEG
jgi:hypothetical protein